MASMWFNSDIWFEMEEIGQVTTYPHMTEVFMKTGDVITIAFEENRVARVRRQRGDKVDIYILGDAAVRYNVEKLQGYAIKHGIYVNVTDPREWQFPVVVEEGQTKDYKGVAPYNTTEVVRGYENIYPYQRITALCLPDGVVRLMRYGERTYKVAQQVRYANWDAFVQANQFVTEIPDEEELSEIEIVEEQEVDVPEEDEGVEVGEEETDDDSSSDYEPEKEREFYRAQAQSRKRRRIEKTMTIRMAVGGGDDENVDQKLVEVDFQFGNMIRARKIGKLYRLDFSNGAYMLAGKGSITYARPGSADAVWCEWKHAEDFREIAVWIWEHPSFERPVVA